LDKDKTTHDPDKATCDPDKATCDPDQATCDPDQATCDPDQATCDPDQATCDPDQSECEPNLEGQDRTKPHMYQTQLDLGQKNWQRQCLECGMFYSPGNEVDESTHKKFHKKKLEPIPFMGFKNQTVLKEFPDGSYVIVVLTEDESNFRREKIQQIRSIVDSELDFVPSHTWLPENEKTYIYVRKRKVLACAVAENIKFAYKVINKDIENAPSPPESSCCVINDKPQQAVIGISRIWVHHQYRKQGVASSLVDVIRSNFVFGQVLKKDLLAFSQPSLDGKRFATKYFGTPEFLVYMCH